MVVNTPDEKNFLPPTIAALSRLAYQSFRERVYSAVRNSGYDDLQPVHVLLFRYPTIADMRPSELAEQMGISKQAMNDLMRQLETKGYLALRPDPSDGRARLITLTERGSELMELSRAVSQDISEEWAQLVGRRRYEAVTETLLQVRGSSEPRRTRGRHGIDRRHDRHRR